jgi:hypothetical protein
MMHADSRSLTSLLLIRDIQNKRNVRTHRVKGRPLSIFDSNFTEESRRAASPACATGEEAVSHRSVGSGMRPIEEDEQEGDEDPEGSGDESGSVAVISEILDVRTKPLISVASVTDYVTSNELVSPSLPPSLVPSPLSAS